MTSCACRSGDGSRTVRSAKLDAVAAGPQVGRRRDSPTDSASSKRIPHVPALTEAFVPAGHDGDAMERNVGGSDKTARIVLGVALGIVSMAVVAWGGVLGTTTQIVVAAVALVVALVLLATASAESCPINSAIGRNTYRGDR